MADVIDHLAIIAGGAGTRLDRIAHGTPKALMSVGETPVLHHQLNLAARSGIRDVTIFAGYGAERIIGSVGDGSAFGLRVRVSVERQPLGTAGALLQSLPMLPEHFLMLYGDLVLGVDLRRFAAVHRERAGDLTVFAHMNDHPHDSDLLEIDAAGNVTAVRLAPHEASTGVETLANGALYAVRRDVLQPWTGEALKRDFVRDILVRLVEGQARVVAYRSSEYLKDMGTATRLEEVQADWQAGRILPPRQLGRGPVERISK